MTTQYYSDEYYAIFPKSWQPWTDAEVRKLKADHPHKTFELLSEEMGRTVSALQVKARKLGLLANHPWTEEHVAILCANWPQQSAAEIAARLGRTAEAVKLKARRLGLPHRRG